MGNKLDFEDPIDISLSMRTILKINFIAEGLIWDLSLFSNYSPTCLEASSLSSYTLTN